MRLFVPALLLLTAAVAPAAPPAEPRPLVVLVHGRGQLGADTAQLRREWTGDMNAALGALGHAMLRDDDVRLAWYADVLDPAVTGACPSASSDGGIAEFTRGFLVSLVSLIPEEVAPADRDARSLLGDVLYFVDPATRCAAEARVANVVGSARAQGRPVVVVGYSLGSVVAYGHLARMRDSLARVQLITLGSPLGIPMVREMVGAGGTLRTPRSVQRWVNVYHPDDGFAGPIGAGAARRDLALRTRASGDPHHASRYLRDEQTATVLADALCAASRDAWSARCAASGALR